MDPKKAPNRRDRECKLSRGKERADETQYGKEKRDASEGGLTRQNPRPLAAFDNGRSGVKKARFQQRKLQQAFAYVQKKEDDVEDEHHRIGSSA